MGGAQTRAVQVTLPHALRPRWLSAATYWTIHTMFTRAACARILTLLCAPFLLAACFETGWNPTPSIDLTAGPCEQAFQSAATASANPGDPYSVLYPAVRVCRSAEQWGAAFDLVNWGGGLRGTAMSALRNVCLAQAVKDEPLCAQLTPNSDVIDGDQGASRRFG